MKKLIERIRHKIKRKRRKYLRRQCDRQFKAHFEELKAGDIVIDCGANLGVFTDSMSAKGATVYAFEPDPYAFAKLTEAVADRPNVILRQAAVGASEGVVKLYRAPNFDAEPDLLSQSSSVFSDKVNIDQGVSFEVPQVDLAAFITGLPDRVKLLKIDIEGAEVPVLEALLDSGAINRVDKAFVETHETRIPSLVPRTEALRARIARECPKRVNLYWI